MPGAVRIGDVNAGGGAATGAGAVSVFINGRAACLEGTSVTPHPCCGAPGCSKHCNAKTTKGSSSVIATGKPINYVGSPDTCGHPRANGSTDVMIPAG
jgi:uncharacterized Zn-binding protein involved in type VI secretion|tara:strand:+ start:2605 stop:2898 length:294 start_codon:yes stop_codon:yes gene_type:complete